MKIKCNNADFQPAITLASKYSAVKSTNPILEGVHIFASDDSIVLRATDGELSIEKRIPAEVDEMFEVVCQGKLIADYVKNIPGEEIEISINESGKMKIKHSQGVANFQCQDATDFPRKEKLEKANFVELNKTDFVNLVVKTEFATAKDDTRPILKGCLLEVTDKAKMVALDGYRLAIASANFIDKSGDFKSVIPAKSLTEMIKALDTTEKVTLYVTENHIYIKSENTQITSRLLSGDFIDYNKIVPSEFKTKAIVEKQKLEVALKRATTLSSLLQHSLLKFQFAENNLQLNSQTDEGNANENVPVEIEGEDITIGFNSRFIADAIRVMGEDYINLNFIDPIKPCVITPTENRNFLCLILPIRQL